VMARRALVRESITQTARELHISKQRVYSIFLKVRREMASAHGTAVPEVLPTWRKILEETGLSAGIQS